MTRFSVPYFLGMSAVSIGIGIVVTLAFKTFATAEWMQDNRTTITTIVGASIIAPWLVVIVRMRLPY